MDEQRLGALFRDAVGDPPPATFGRAEVVAASHRATARRRNALASGTLLGVAVLTGALTVGGHLVGEQAPTAGQSPPEAGVTAADLGRPRTLGAPPGEQTSCGPVDGELVTQLSAVLAAGGAAVTGASSEVPGPCPDGSRAAAVPVSGGTLYLLVVGQGLPVNVALPAERAHAVALNGGRELVVISLPGAPGQPAPLADDVPELARELAKRL